MAKVPTDKVRQSFHELSGFVSRQDVVNSLERAAKDKKLLWKAKTNPEAFLRAEGRTLPARAKFTISQERTAVSGQIRLCVRVCRLVGRFLVCVQICITIIFQA